MRALFLTTIILTMLAQPVWASEVREPHPYCEEIYAKLYKKLLLMGIHQKKFEDGTMTQSDYSRVIAALEESSIGWATIYNAMCKK